KEFWVFGVWPGNSCTDPFRARRSAPLCPFTKSSGIKDGMESPRTSQKRPMGRPPVRAAASALALAGIDTTACDPREVLRSIALDASAPHSARVQAAKALLLDEKPANPMKIRA